MGISLAYFTVEIVMKANAMSEFSKKLCNAMFWLFYLIHVTGVICLMSSVWNNIWKPVAYVSQFFLLCNSSNLSFAKEKMDFDAGETTLNICNSTLIYDVSGQLVMTDVIFLLWLDMFRSQGIWSGSILLSTTTSPVLTPPFQFCLGEDWMICVMSCL